MGWNFHKLAWKKRKEGTIGIGTLIVFIALVLVAAIASAVILRTAYALKDSAEKTGNAAVSEVAGGIKVLDIVGDRQGANPEIRRVRFLVTVFDGSPGIDVSKMMIHWIGPTKSEVLSLQTAGAAPTPSNTQYAADDFNNDGGADGWDWVAGTGPWFLLNDNMIYIEIDLNPPNTGIGDRLDPGDSATIYFEAASGLVVSERFTTPNSYGTSQYVDLTMQ